MNLDPQTIQAILAANQNNPEFEALARQQKIADTMRQKGLSQVDPIQAGRRVLPNYGGAISNLASGYAASKMQPQVDAGMKDLQGKNVDARRQYLEALMATMRRATPQGPMSPQPPPPAVQQPQMPGPPMQPGYT